MEEEMKRALVGRKGRIKNNLANHICFTEVGANVHGCDNEELIPCQPPSTKTPSVQRLRLLD
jgi:hypothetical protein